MARGQGVEQELLKILRFGGLDRENLAALVKIVAGFTNKGLNHIKVFPKGIPPVYQGLEVKSLVQVDRLSSVLSAILSEVQVNSVVVFPYGVPVFDVAEIIVGLGPTPGECRGMGRSVGWRPTPESRTTPPTRTTIRARTAASFQPRRRGSLGMGSI